MAFISFKLPDLGEGIVESEVSIWHVTVGDAVEEDDLIAEVQTEKAVVEITSPVAGIVTELGCEAGFTLAVGAELIRFDVDGEASDIEGISTSLPNEQPSAHNQAKPEDGHSDHLSSKPVLASPSLRRRAREAGIDLSDVSGTGPGGRISHGDFDRLLEVRSETVTPARQTNSGSNEIKITGMRRVIARRMQATKQRIPHYSYIEEVDVTELEALRIHLNANREDHQAKLTLLPFIIQALVKVLPEFRFCNARFDDEAEVLTEFDAVHAGIATMTDSGLTVPVVRHCETIDIWQAAAEVSRVATLARTGKATTRDLSGSTISVTSLGALGGIATTPVINVPETTIIGVNKMQERPVIRSGRFVARNMMNVSASFDHRIVDGFDGARLVQALKTKLEHPGALFV